MKTLKAMKWFGYILLGWLLLTILMALTACSQVSIAKQNIDVPSEVRPTDQDVFIQPVVNQTELEVKAQPEVNQTRLGVTIQPETIRNFEAICFRNTNETRLLINDIYGYCLQYPAEYDVAFPNPTEITFFKNSIFNSSQPNFSITVQPANGMTVEQAAEAVVYVYSVPGLETHQIEIYMDGVKAIVLDGLTGQDPNRQVVVVHNDTLYTLHFTLMSKDQPEVFAQAEDLYKTVTQTFNFHPGANMCPECP